MKNKKQVAKKKRRRLRDFFSVHRTECSKCKGTGWRKGDIYAPDREACWDCGGKGWF